MQAWKTDLETNVMMMLLKILESTEVKGSICLKWDNVQNRVKGIYMQVKHYWKTFFCIKTDSFSSLRVLF